MIYKKGTPADFTTNYKPMCTPDEKGGTILDQTRLKVLIHFFMETRQKKSCLFQHRNTLSSASVMNDQEQRAFEALLGQLLSYALTTETL